MKRTIVVLGILTALVGCKSEPGTGGGNGGGEGGGGAAPSIGITCQEFKEFSRGCFDAFCKGPDSAKPFCGCYKQGQDIDTTTCECVELDLNAVCAQVDLASVDESSLSCEPINDVLRGACSI